MAVTTGPLEREGPYGVSRIVFRMVAKLLENVANHPTIVVQCGLSHTALGSHPLTEGVSKAGGVWVGQVGTRPLACKKTTKGFVPTNVL